MAQYVVLKIELMPRDLNSMDERTQTIRVIDSIIEKIELTPGVVSVDENWDISEETRS